MHMNLFDFFFKDERKPKRKYTKHTYKEKDCEVSYHPEWLFKMNLPYAQYIEYTQI